MSALVVVAILAAVAVVILPSLLEFIEDRINEDKESNDDQS